MAINLDLSFKLLPDVVCQQVENETLLLNPNTGDIFGLDGVSTRVWEIMQLHSNMMDVQSQMLEEFDVDDDQLGNDLSVFFQQLVSLNLIATEENK